ncbi:MAG: quinoprotein dehydrogenase-associated SoxYZ-like carrier [Gammaproteobacteria bacterium]|nr:quinoprotein dehydrogenase-associated SoxYZ-like carrier [Gammaproteobacteria bacterium]
MTRLTAFFFRTIAACLGLGVSVCPLFALAAGGQQSEIDLWSMLLKPKYFQARPITSGKSIIEMRIPLRAEDAGVVPVSIDARIPQTPERYIKEIFVFVDKNPKPLAGHFFLTPELGQADLALRLRINEFTTVHVVAELNNGELYMDEGYTRASGGCSEPPPFLKLKEARGRIGEMKFRATHSDKTDTALAQLIISHPNITGLQLDQRTRAFIPAEYVTKVVINFNGSPILTAETDISLSEDPSFRFFFRPKHGGTIEAHMTDSKGREVTHTFTVGGA